MIDFDKILFFDVKLLLVSFILLSWKIVSVNFPFKNVK